MYIATGFSGMDTFERDLETLVMGKQEVNIEKIVEDVSEELERLGNSGEESYTYQAFGYRFDFRMESVDDIILNMSYVGYATL